MFYLHHNLIAFIHLFLCATTANYRFNLKFIHIHNVSETIDPIQKQKKTQMKSIQRDSDSLRFATCF